MLVRLAQCFDSFVNLKFDLVKAPSSEHHQDEERCLALRKWKKIDIKLTHFIDQQQTIKKLYHVQI